MARDSLATLIKIRRVACDEAVKQLAAALAAEETAAQAVHEGERTLAKEAATAKAIDGTDAMVEAFGAWLPVARRKLEAARATLTALQAETVRARAELTICKTALETVEQLQTERTLAAERCRDRQVERELADRPHPGFGTGMKDE